MDIEEFKGSILSMAQLAEVKVCSDVEDTTDFRRGSMIATSGNVTIALKVGRNNIVGIIVMLTRFFIMQLKLPTDAHTIHSVEVEIKRLQKKIDIIQSSIDKLNTRMSSPTYIEKVSDSQRGRGTFV